MSMNITIDGGKRIQAKFQHMGPAIRASARRELGLIGEHLATYGRSHFEESGLKVRSGDLRRSMAAMPVEEDAHGLTGGMLAGQGLKYAPLQEFGGTIVPVNASMLAIPMEEVLTPAGVARFSPRDAESAGYDRIFFSNVGSQLMMWGSKDGQIFPLFLMVRSVTVPAKPSAGPTLDANRVWIEGRLKRVVDEGIAGAE
jgi:hypothetical protein